MRESMHLSFKDKNVEWYRDDLDFRQWEQTISPTLITDALKVARHAFDDSALVSKIVKTPLYKRIQVLKRTFVDQYPGFLLITDVGDYESQAEPIELCKILSLCLGDLVSQQHKLNTMIREVKDRGLKLGSGGRYSDSNEGGSFHNDGSPYPLPLPDYNILFCVNQAPVGGELLILCIESLYKHLKKFNPETLEVLSHNFHFDRRGDIGPNGELTVEKPIFYIENGHVCMTYLRDYIDAGHALPDIQPLSQEQIKALDTLDSLLNDPKFSIVGKLRPNEMIIMNNKRTLHSRTAFTDDPQLPRLMLRVWVNSRARDVGAQDV